MLPTIRPTVRLLSDDLADKIIDEALQTLETVGVSVQNEEATQLLLGGGAKATGPSKRICIPRAIVEEALRSAPAETTSTSILVQLRSASLTMRQSWSENRSRLTSSGFPALPRSSKTFTSRALDSSAVMFRKRSPTATDCILRFSVPPSRLLPGRLSWRGSNP